MKSNLCIIIGYNFNNLLGSENDAILIYNLFYSFYLRKNYKFNYLKPILLLNKDAKIIEIVKKIKLYNNIDKLIIFFSGHGYPNKLCFYDNKIKKEVFYNKINESLKNKTELFVILDSCYGESFYIKNIYDKIIKLTLLSSTKSFQKSNEGLINYNDYLFKIIKPKNYNNKIVLGIFTYNFCKILLTLKYNFYDNLNDIYNHPIWNQIKNICDQNFIIKII